MRVVFDEQDFCKLVRGGVVSKMARTANGMSASVEIILQDIGYRAMLNEIQDLMDIAESRRQFDLGV